MKYIPPEVGDNKVIYKGKRYWIVEFTGKDKIDGFGRENCQFIMYDKDSREILAYIDIKNRKYFATLAWGVDEFPRIFDKVKELVESVIEMDRYYAKHYFGLM